ncbi:hypothetical protein SEA_LAHQTEMISH_15 [Microbacterium phage Lahqtemish]|uniref:hypothetical protein n=1 Tax=Microbacterium phage Lahqtemish TaxID=2776867 RepID=UPI0018A67CA4|nr:hypothetical protein QDW25_gp15 [Microbacterium phage Lahqtemish]QOP66661.1 hypothetical protein SEA_LAHQTEMISH_15 [Microbacterium phage Lahqtemish]
MTRPGASLVSATSEDVVEPVRRPVRTGPTLVLDPHIVSAQEPSTLNTGGITSLLDGQTITSHSDLSEERSAGPAVCN